MLDPVYTILVLVAGTTFAGLSAGPPGNVTPSMLADGPVFPGTAGVVGLVVVGLVVVGLWLVGLKLGLPGVYGL